MEIIKEVQKIEFETMNYKQNAVYDTRTKFQSDVQYG